MNPSATGKTGVKAALERLKHLPFEDVAYAHIDHHRSLRHGMPEVIYCEGKTVEQITGIIKRMLKMGSDILATRASDVVFKAVKKAGQPRSLPQGIAGDRH